MRIFARLLRGMRVALYTCTRPLGYFVFVLALAALSASARLLGRQTRIGLFAASLARISWRYPEVARRGGQVAWFAWLVLFALAVSSLDPIHSHWDEVVLAVFALGGAWLQAAIARRANR
jgi:hypothetical protein